MSMISWLHARQILDSRGNPTVEVEVALANGQSGRASVPSGASTGSHEALERRDHNIHRFGGKGVEDVIRTINGPLRVALLNNDPFDQASIDSELVLRDGTPDLSNFGANAILSVSLAVSKAAAATRGIPYWQYINELMLQLTGVRPQPKLPLPFFNIMNGGAHTNWESTDIQEFMVVPVGAPSFAEGVRWGSEIYQQLKVVLDKEGLSTNVGDEGGFAPSIRSDEQAVEFILTAIQRAGYRAGEQVQLSLDAAASEWWEEDHYHLRRQEQQLSSAQLIEHWSHWIGQYPIFSLEDGLNEDDWAGWQQLYQRLQSKVLIVGDDHLVTNIERIQKAIELKTCDTLLMKLNQIGTLTESLQAIALSQKAGWKVIVSHRSGETEDTSIADIVVGTGVGYIKAGAPARSERTAKYNQLLRIAEQLPPQA